MSSRFLPAASAGLLLLAACGGPDPTAAPEDRALQAGPALAVTAETNQLEGMARRLALALADTAFRARLHQRLEASPFPEHKIQLQRTLLAEGRAELREVARLNREPEGRTDSVLAATQALEVYLPVPEHRAAWKGDTKVLVATAARDGDLPVAYDLQGRRHLLDPTRPPRTPVLAAVPVETDFDRPLPSGNAACQPPACSGGSGGGGGGGGGGGSGGSQVTPGLYMTKAHFVDDFEGWLKGSPEFEIHILGQAGTTDSLQKYRCAGEHQGSPYYWDGDTDWTGSVLLYSQAEINAYHLTHPGESFRIVALEDDDTACEIKVDNNRWKTFVGTIGPLYKDFTGAADSGGYPKILKAATSLKKFLASLASLIKTNDDLIGNAMEDVVVGEFHPGYNWILRADNNVTNGWIALQMK